MKSIVTELVPNKAGFHRDKTGPAEIDFLPIYDYCRANIRLPTIQRMKRTWKTALVHAELFQPYS